MARRNKREFVWARAVGNLFTSPAVGAPAFAGVDLLADVRATYGNDALRNATVMAVKGIVRPNPSINTELFIAGVSAIRVCNSQDTVAPVAENQTPGGALGQELDWMGYFPWYVDQDAASTRAADATWNHAGSPWAVDVRSSRRMFELGMTLGLFTWASVTSSTDLALDYHLSIGVKLA